MDSILKLSIPLNTEGSVDEPNITQENIFPQLADSDMPLNLARFRHASCLTLDNKLFIHGGKYFDEATGISNSFNDAYLIDSQFKTVKVNIDEVICTARHSHCVNSWKHYLIISGGIDQNENPLNDIIILNCQTFEMKKIIPSKGYIFPR